MTTINAIMNELAFIATQMEMLQTRKENLEALVIALSEKEAKKEYIAPSINIIEKIEEAETLPPPPEVIYIDITEEEVISAHREAEQDRVVANSILTILNHTSWCDSAVYFIGVRYATWTPEEGTPITLTAVMSKDHIARYAIDCYDAEGEIIATSDPFIISALGSDIVKYLRKKPGFSTYKKGTYKPVSVILGC